MDAIYSGLTLFLLLNLLGGLIRILRGPTRADRLLAAQLFGTTGVGVLLVLAEATATPAFRDAALIFALLAALNAIVFVTAMDGSAPAANLEDVGRR
jgi:multicomponent Na+:H+ antiporter subunit F